MEELALYLTLARVISGGLECIVKQVSLCAELKLISSLILQQTLVNTIAVMSEVR